MGKLFFAAAVSALAFAATAQAMPAPEPQVVLIPVRVEQVTASAHLVYHAGDRTAPALEGRMVVTSELPVFTDGGCRMRDSAQDAAPNTPSTPNAPKSPTTSQRAPTRDDQASMRLKGRWVACS